MVGTSQQAYEILRSSVADLPHEEFWLLMLDRGNRVLHRSKVSQGGMHGTVADPKLIFREALERFGESEVPLPPFWGGYRLEPATIEFWQGRRSRLQSAPGAP